MDNYIIGIVRRISSDFIRKTRNGGDLHFFDLIVDTSNPNEFGGIVIVRYRFEESDYKASDEVARSIYEQIDKIIGNKVKIECVSIDAKCSNILNPSRYTPITKVSGGVKNIRKLSSLAYSKKKNEVADDEEIDS